MRTFDKKHLCKFFLIFERDREFNFDCPSLDQRVRWCTENIPEDRLWCYEHEPYRYGNKTRPTDQWTLRFFFEIEEDAMAFKMIWC